LTQAVFRPAKLAIIIVIGADFAKNKRLFLQHFESQERNIDNESVSIENYGY
jgi:hypothetical protein